MGGSEACFLDLPIFPDFKNGFVDIPYPPKQACQNSFMNYSANHDKQENNATKILISFLWRFIIEYEDRNPKKYNNFRLYSCKYKSHSIEHR